LTQLIDNPQFDEYRRIFTKFGFGYQLQGYLLGAIYPIEDFLKDGRAEVKIRKNRQTARSLSSNYPSAASCEPSAWVL
jgi:hypothetical protein